MRRPIEVDAQYARLAMAICPPGSPCPAGCHGCLARDLQVKAVAVRAKCLAMVRDDADRSEQVHGRQHPTTKMLRNLQRRMKYG
jgi:hypothetical protein